MCVLGLWMLLTWRGGDISWDNMALERIAGAIAHRLGRFAVQGVLLDRHMVE